MSKVCQFLSRVASVGQVCPVCVKFVSSVPSVCQVLVKLMSSVSSVCEVCKVYVKMCQVLVNCV